MRVASYRDLTRPCVLCVSVTVEVNQKTPVRLNLSSLEPLKSKAMDGRSSCFSAMHQHNKAPPPGPPQVNWFQYEKHPTSYPPQQPPQTVLKLSYFTLGGIPLLQTSAFASRRAPCSICPSFGLAGCSRHIKGQQGVQCSAQVLRTVRLPSLAS